MFSEISALKMRLEQLELHERKLMEEISIERKEIFIRLKEIDELNLDRNYPIYNQTEQTTYGQKKIIYPLLFLKH